MALTNSSFLLSALTLVVVVVLANFAIFSYLFYSMMHAFLEKSTAVSSLELKSARLETLLQDFASVKQDLLDAKEDLQKTKQKLQESNLDFKKFVCSRSDTVFSDKALSNGKRLYFYSSGSMISWRSARESCEARGSALLTIKSEVDIRLIIAETESRGMSYVWLSATDFGRTPRNFYWGDGTLLDKNNTRWSLVGDSFSYSSSRCVFIYNKKLRFAPCNYVAYYVCESPIECY